MMILESAADSECMDWAMYSIRLPSKFPPPVPVPLFQSSASFCFAPLVLSLALPRFASNCKLTSRRVAPGDKSGDASVVLQVVLFHSASKPRQILDGGQCQSR